MKIALFLFALAWLLERVARYQGLVKDQGSDDCFGINPATMLPMQDEFTDIAGNPIGLDNGSGSIGGYGNDSSED